MCLKKIPGLKGSGISLLWAIFFTITSQSQEAPSEKKPSLAPAATSQIDFKRDIQSIFSKNCTRCHGPDLQMSSLRLDDRKMALAGGNSGQVIKPGNSAESKLIRLVAGLEEGKVMPPEGERLSTEEIGLLRAWIDQGAEWPEQPSLPAVASKSSAKKIPWSFTPPKRPLVPDVVNKAWVRNPIDTFVLRRLEKEGTKPSPEAERVTLIRRLSLDLIGLPPTPREVEDFVVDKRTDAYERLVNRLLDSPHYGEKWARQWLDLARYADSDGYYLDRLRPHAWRYRQWVIEALNRNMPFDQFTIEQIAGDLLPDATVEQKVATGFNRNTLTNREGGTDLEEFRVEQVIDRTSTLGTVWLGLTVGCARCHDHKYDPISQKEFYQLTAFFNDAMEVNIEAPLPGEMGPYLHGKSEYDKKRKALLAEYQVPDLQNEWEKKVREATAHPGVNVPYDVAWNALQRLGYGGEDYIFIDPSQRTQKQQDILTDHFVEWYAVVTTKERYEELKFTELREKLAKLAQEYQGLTEAQTIAQNPRPPKTHVLIRGDFRQPGIEVQPDTLGLLPPLPHSPEPPRLRLARWLVSKNNPLTPRVMINRMWQDFFGRGLVETSQDFGNRGESPTYPKLLDWLATEFAASQWSVKKMHKLIVSSATYRQSSDARKELQTKDPYNKLLARQSRLRLSAELIRDNALAVSGLLNPAVGGKSVSPPLPTGVYEFGIASEFGGKWSESQGPDRYRRGLYTLFQRTIPYPQLMNFDAPNSFLTCSRRERSTTPLQALNLLNDPVFFEAAQGLAMRLLREASGTPGDRVEYAFRLCLARAPSADEKERLLKYYKQQKEILDREPSSTETMFPTRGIEGVDVTEATAWVGVSSVLLNLDEFITRG